jgi:hypothetical protein
MEDDDVYIDVFTHAATLLFYQRNYGNLPQSTCEFNGTNYWEYIRGVDHKDLPRHKEFNPVYFGHLGLRDGEIPDFYTGGVHVGNARIWLSQCREIINSNPVELVDQYVDSLVETFDKIGKEVKVDEPTSILESRAISELHVKTGSNKNMSLVYAILAMHNIAKSVMRDFASWGCKTREEYQYPYENADTSRLVMASEALVVARELLSLCAVHQVVDVFSGGRQRAKADGASGGEARSKRFESLRLESIGWVIKKKTANGWSLSASCRRFISDVYEQKSEYEKVLKEDSDQVRTVRNWVTQHLKRQ